MKNFIIGIFSIVNRIIDWLQYEGKEQNGIKRSGLLLNLFLNVSTVYNYTLGEWFE